jgi:hypothetical protein
MKHTAYPTVWYLVEFYLAIPSSSTSSERAFSATRHVISDECGRLGAEISRGEIIFTKSNMGLLPK